MKFYISDFNGMLRDLKELVGPNHLTTPRDADAWVWWQDVQGSYGDLIKACRETGWSKPTYTVQHGRAATRDYAAPNSFPFLSDYFFCWGKADYDRMASLGYQDRTRIVGCPLNSRIKPHVRHDEKVVLFVPANTGKEEPENIATYYKLLATKYEKASKKVYDLKAPLKDHWDMSTNQACKDFDVVAKLLPWHDKNMYHGRVLVGTQYSPKNNDLVFELLRNVDAVVGLDEGTTETFAYAHDVPVIVVDGFKFRQHKPNGRDYVEVDIDKTKAATHVKLDDLGEALDFALAHPEHLRQERREVAEAEMGVHLPDPTKTIYNSIREDMKARD